MPLKEVRTIVNLLKELPQAKYFWPGAMERWADRVVHRDDSGMPPERLVKRLGGLTGTQTGPIVGAARGEVDPFNETPERLVREKLLVDLPIDQTGDMRRGIGLEPVLKEMYLGKSRSVSHVAALDAIRNYGGSSEHPWLLGTPDEISVDYIGGKIFLLDYKCPYQPPKPEDIPFRYRAQLHHYRIIAKRIGIVPDGMGLVELDLKEWVPRFFPIEYDEKIEKDILEYGSMLWYDYILKGVIPPGPEKTRLDLQELEPAFERLSALKAIADSADRAFKDTKEDIAAVVHTRSPFFQGSLQAGKFLSISAKSEIDTENAIHYLCSQGYDPSSLYSPKKGKSGLDSEKMLNELVRLGKDPEEFRKKEPDPEKILAALRKNGISPETFAFPPDLTVRPSKRFETLREFGQNLIDETVRCKKITR